MIFRLHDDDIRFPDPTRAEEDGLLAVGGDLRPERLLAAYRQGIFPWYSDDTPILWYSPHERFVLFPNELKISKSMRQVMRSSRFTISQNKAFSEVIRACAEQPRAGQDGTWITSEMRDAYVTMHELGYAQSVEVWEGSSLVGGLYGISYGRVFCGESMFAKVSNASKLALAHLCSSQQYDLIDCQVYTDHLASLGAKLIARATYMEILLRQNF